LTEVGDRTPLPDPRGGRGRRAAIDAVRYVGLPFEARDAAGDGFECWDLVRAVFRDCAGIELPAYGEIAAAETARVAAAFDAATAGETWIRTMRPRAFDVAVMRAREKRLGSRIRHCGVMIDGTRMLHLEVNTATVLVPAAHPSVKFRIAGFYRHWALA
jgi:cell wall-associated NlpC family hydrolase